ncbi:MAG: hypothetical protein ACKOYN_06110 [Planctomycetota bacterium]
MTEDDGTAESPDIDAVDRAWLARKATVGSVVLGALSIVTSPFALGLLFGALALRGSIDMRRRGIRGPLPPAGIALGFTGIVASVAFAVAWGSLLVGVLLGRDAMRQAEQWKGRTVEQRMVAVDGGSAVSFALVADRSECARTALLFVDGVSAVTPDAIAAVAAAHALHPTCCVAIVALDRDPAAVRAAMVAAGAALPLLAPDRPLPPPLDMVAAIPTLVVIGPDGRIETALVGVRPREDLELLFSGQAALGPSATQAR